MKHTKIPTTRSANGNGSAPPARAIPSAVLPGGNTPPPDEMIAVRAYFHSELRGFAPGNELADWFQAEAELKNGSSRIS